MLFKDDAEKDSKESSDDSTTEEKEDAEEEDSAEETEEQDEESEESEEESEEETSNEAVAKKYLSDPNSVPKELQPVFKKMQAIFTRGMQGVAEAKTKAQRFDRLLAHPAFQSWVREQQGVTSRKRNSKEELDDEDDSDEEEEDKPVTMKSIKKLFGEFREETKNSSLMEREDEQMRAEAKVFKKNNPDWSMYKSEIFEVLDRNPRLSYEEAYYLVTKEEDVVKSAEERIRDKKRAKTNKPNPSSVKGDVQKTKKKMTVREAAEAAAKKLGISW
jgi:hypothetical protein